MLSGRRPVLGALALACVACVACSVLTDFDRYDRESALASPPGDAGADSSATTDASASSAPDIDADAGQPGIHPNGTFESGCDAWYPFQSTLAPSGVARTGSGACLVCGDGTDTYFSADDRGSISNPPVGAEYRVVVWVRAAPGRPPLARTSLTLRTINRTPFTVFEDAKAQLDAPDETWQKLETRLTVTKPAEALNVTLGAYNVSNPSCYLIDDVMLERIR